MRGYGIMRILYFLLCIIVFSPVVCAYNENDLEWACGNSKKLHLGETISNGNYTVEAYNFPRNNDSGSQIVGIKLYEKGTLVAEEILKDGDEYIHDDDVRITALELSLIDPDWTADYPEEGWARIKIERRGLPLFDVRFETDKEDCPAYTSHIEVEIIISNRGDARADDVDIRIDGGGLELVAGKTGYHYSGIERGDRVDAKPDTAAADPITLRFKLPPVAEDRIFNLTVETEYRDIKGTRYHQVKSCPVEVTGVFEISKSITKNIYMDELATVTISLRNNGICTVSPIEVSDTVPPNFELIDNSTLAWELDLGAGECQSLTYRLKPTLPRKSGYILPAAVAQWIADNRTNTARSNSPSIAVYGPKICLSKSVSPDVIGAGDAATVAVTVTVRAENAGNVLASVDVTDCLPEDAVLVSGDLKIAKVLKGGEELVFDYVMRVNGSGSIELPAAAAHFVDTHDYEGTVLSERPSIMLHQKTVTPSVADTPIETHEEDTELHTTGLELRIATLFTLAGILVISAFAVIRFRRDR
jgi:uncharacterized repeat protein (TIGR01451 family)